MAHTLACATPFFCGFRFGVRHANLPMAWNLLAHRYRSVDHALLYDIVRDHLRPLVREIGKALPD